MTVERSLIIPMFDEASRIEASLRAIADSPLHASDTEIILVDDGSTDGTAEFAESVVHRLGLAARVLRLGRNVGKGGAVRAGVLVAQGRVVAFVDADLSAAPDAVVSCFEHIEAGKGDVVVTTRVHPEAVILDLPPITRRYGGKVFNTLLRVLGLTAMSDTQCGLKAFTADAARALFADLTVHGFAFDVEILRRAQRTGYTVVELPIEWRHVEASRVRPLRDGGRMALDAVRIRLGDRRSAAPRPGAPAMDDARFPVMARLEREHWWFAAKRRLVLDALRREGARAGPAVDVGCGTGAMVDDLRAAGLAPVIGIDLAGSALALARAGREDEWVAANAQELPFRESSFRCVTSLDVIEHLDDDAEGLREYARVVEPGGLVIVAVPAYSWAWSDHDVALGHRRRYTEGSLRAAMEDAGLTVLRTTYFHSWLVPAAFALRRSPLRRFVRGSAEEASFVSARVNRVLTLVVAVERRLLGRIDLPFGLSVLAVASRR